MTALVDHYMTTLERWGTIILPDGSKTVRLDHGDEAQNISNRAIIQSLIEKIPVGQPPPVASVSLQPMPVVHQRNREKKKKASPI